MRLKKILGRTTVRGHTNWWKTWPLWNKRKLLLSKIVQENASHKNDRYWTDEQNTVLSCTITRSMEIHQHWTVPWQTQRMTTSYFEKKVQAAVQLLKKGKSAGVDNIPAELAQAGGEDVITALTKMCNKIWQTGEWLTLWTQSLVITLPEKGNLQQCQNYRKISLISYQSKAMLKIILKKIEAASEDQCWRTGRL